MYSTGAEGVGGVKLSTGRTWRKINGLWECCGGMYITWSFASWIDLLLYDISLFYYIPRSKPPKHMRISLQTTGMVVA